MQFTNTLIALVSASLVSAAAPPAVTATSSPFQVKVGANNLTYTPSNIIAAPGTKIEFSFFPKNHTVTQSSFSDPCHPLAGGFFSGFVPTQPAAAGSSSFTITVNDTKPIWFYCSQTAGDHCQRGMVGSINAPQTGNRTLEAFINLAKNATKSTFPDGGVSGGILKVSGGNGNLSSTANTAGPTAGPTASGTFTTAIPPTTLSLTTTEVGTFPGPTAAPTETPIEASAGSSLSANVLAVLGVVAGFMAML